MNIGKLRTELKNYFLNGSAVNDIMSSLRKGSAIRISSPHIVDLTIKKIGRNRYTVEDSQGEDVDVFVKVPLDFINQLLEKSIEKPDELLQFIVKYYFDSQTNSNISVKFNSGLLKLTAKGYFKLLSIGGPALRQFLRGEGMGSLSSIKKTISNIANK